MTFRRLRVLVGCAAACFTVASCGSTPSRASDVARGNAICNSAVRAARALRAETGMASYISRLVPILRREQTALQALPRPRADRAVLDLFLRAQRETIDEVAALGAAAQRGDSAQVARLRARLAANPAPAYASAYGLTDCAEAPGTGVAR